MTNLEQSLIRANDLRAGRVIPVWRYGLMYLITLGLFFAARVLPDGFWWSFGVCLGWIIAYAALIGPFKMRTIS